MRRLLILLLVLSGAGLLVRGAAPCEAWSLQPACSVTINPGPVANALELVEIGAAETSDSAGQLLLTTVVVDTSLTFAEWVESFTSARVVRSPRELYLPSGQDLEDYRRQNVVRMENSQLTAEVAALRALGYSFDVDPDGAQVLEIAETTGFEDGQIEVDDVVVAIDDQPIRSTEDVIAVLDRRSVGDTITLDVRRDGRPVTVSVELVDNPAAPGTPLIGVLLRPYIELPVAVQIDAGNVGGPSAGLMFALAIVDQLTPQDLTGGLVVAGTGEIDLDGAVGPIGGIQQKILGALAHDPVPTVFLVPERNVAEAAGTPTDEDLLLVPVTDLDDALDALARLRAGEIPDDGIRLNGG